MPMMKEDEIVAWIAGRLNACLNDDGGDISSARQDNFDRYMGEPYGDERKGYSKVVTRECFEAVEWALPSIMRVFTAGDRVVTFDALGPDDEEKAEQETDTVNWYLSRNGQDFTLFYEVFKEALMSPTAYIKAWMEEQDSVETEIYEGLTTAQLGQLLADDNVEPVEMDVMQDPMLGEIYSVKIKRSCKKPLLKVQATPGEQVLVSSDCTSINLDEADFVCHRVQRTATYLREMGVPQSFLDDVGGGDDQMAGGEEENRHLYVEDNDEEDDQPAMKRYWVNEAYCRLDVDRDGLAERRCITLIGDKVWDNYEHSYQPFIAFSAMLMQFKHAGMSLIDSMKDIQRISTALVRQLLDNVYAVNNRRKFVGEGALVDGGATLQALANPLADIVPTRDASQIVPEVIPSVVGDILPVMDVIDRQKKVRTGVSPELSLDPNVLQQSTAGAFANALDQANQKLELITRTFAETGVRQLMMKIHRLLREHMDIQSVVKLRGKWVEVNPADWVERNDLTVQVGLGFNSKERTLATIMQVLQVQREAMQAGIATPKNIYNALAKLIEAAGLKDPGLYFTDPDTIEPQQPQPDPTMQIAQMQFQLDQQRIQIDREKLQLQAQDQQNTQKMDYMQLENAFRELAAKFTELELKYGANVPGSVV